MQRCLAPPHLLRQSAKRKKLFITADEHYRHKKILIYQERPWETIEDHDKGIQEKHNNRVGKDDQVIHVGDFCFGSGEDFANIVRNLNGTHYFMDGSHDRALWQFFDKVPADLQSRAFFLPKLFEFTFNKKAITLNHYAMTKWWKSHYAGSYHFFGHSHGHHTTNPGCSIDIGVDCHGFAPVEITAAIETAEKRWKRI